jgi:hypothetical protein
MINQAGSDSQPGKTLEAGLRDDVERELIVAIVELIFL